MRAFFAALVLANLVPVTAAQAEAAVPPPDLCVVDVKDGRATEADIGAAYRMVFWTDVIPNLGQIYIQPLNRGGRWTIDREGRFREFEGVFPTREIRRRWVADGAGRIIGASDRDLFVIEPPDDAFRHLLTLEDFEAGRTWNLSHLPHSDTIFVDTSRDLFELRGDTLVRSEFAIEASDQGFGTIYAPTYVASLNAHLIESRSGWFFLRAADGTWQSVHRLACGGTCRLYYPEIFDLENERLLIVKTAKELFAVDVTDPREPRVTAIYRSRAKIWQRGMRLSEETGAFLIYDDDVFQRLAADRNAPLVDPEDSWLLQLTANGFQPVPGAIVMPRSTRIGDNNHYHTGLTIDLPHRGQVLIASRDGIVLFDGEAARLVPDSGPDRLSSISRPAFSNALDRLFIPSRNGLFELTEDDRVVRLDTPFDATGYPRLQLFDAPHIGVMILATRDGVFALDRQGDFHAVPGEHSFTLHNSVEFVGVLPGTGDVLFRGRDALHLVTPRPCPE